METTLLKSFLKVAELGSFSDAAAHLNASQSTISGHIAKLEERLHTQLFQRTTRRCRLTTAGEALRPHATEIIAAVERLQDSFLPSEMGGAIRLGVPDDYHIFSALTETIQGFLTTRPRVTVQIDSGLSENHRKGLRDGILDIAILRTQSSGEDDLNLMAESQLVWIASPALDLDQTGPLPLAHVSGPCLYFKAATVAIETAGDQWRSLYSCGTLEGVRTAVKSGMAVGAIPREDCNDPSVIRAHPRLPPLPSFGVRILVAQDDPPVLVRVLTELLRKQLGNHSIAGGQKR
jgi:DNA-binding transcriptional LysR family regulator